MNIKFNTFKINFFFFIFSILFLITSVFVNFFHYDEAFYFSKLQNLADHGIYENFNKRELIFRKDYIYLLSKININLDIFNSYFINRYISLIFSLGTLVFLNKILNEFLNIF